MARFLSHAFNSRVKVLRLHKDFPKSCYITQNPFALFFSIWVSKSVSVIANFFVFMMKFIIRLNRNSSVASPPPPLPPSSAAAGQQSTAESGGHGGSKSLLGGGEGSGASGSVLSSKSSSSNQNLSISDPNNGNSGSPQGQNQTHNSQPKTDEKPNLGGAGGDGFLRWGMRKRSRRKAGDKSGRHATPPPSGVGGGIDLKPHGNVGSPSGRSRNLEDNLMGVGGGSGGGVGGGSSISRSVLGKRPHSAAEKTEGKKVLSSPFGGPIKKNKPSDSLAEPEQPNSSNHSPPPKSGVAAEVGSLNKSSEVVSGLPRIIVGLSRKEKEEDFLQMKGTKLPQRPTKKRPKAVERNLRYCFPGMFLSDISGSKYEVRERKSSRKPKRRGLKGMESGDSD